MQNIVSKIVEILQENEESLSDGYEHYCGEGHVEETLKGIAEEIARLLEEYAAEQSVQSDGGYALCRCSTNIPANTAGVCTFCNRPRR